MYVKNIKIINFRNYNNVYIELSKNTNLFIGQNAQGKTNLLESIYISALGRSYKNTGDRELINFDKNEAYIAIEVENDMGTRLIEIKYDRSSKKRVRINKLEIERYSELVGNLNVVIFAPEDLDIVKEGPSRRRDFLNLEISQLKPIYRSNISKYNRILYQRNKLLKSFYYKSNYSQLEPWNIQLVETGTEIILERMKFIERISEISKKIHAKISGNAEKLDINYNPSFNIENLDVSNRENIRAKFFAKIEKVRELEAKKKTTEYGPHKDDMNVLIDNVSCKKFGSQGQQRTAALSLKLAEVELIHSETGEYPVLLLDDVLSELDSARRQFLISTFKNIQTIITSTDNIDFLNNREKKIFNIKGGKVYV